MTGCPGNVSDPMTRGINSSCIRLYYLGGKCHIYVGLINLFSTNKTIHNATTLSSRKWRFWLSNFCHFLPLILYFHTLSGIDLMCPFYQGFCNFSFFCSYPVAACILAFQYNLNCLDEGTPLVLRDLLLCC